MILMVLSGKVDASVLATFTKIIPTNIKNSYFGTLYLGPMDCQGFGRGGGGGGGIDLYRIQIFCAITGDKMCRLAPAKTSLLGRLC